MTTARALAHRILNSVGGGGWKDSVYEIAARDIAAALAERERETVERCAVIAENMADGWFTELAKEIAAAIRNQSEK